MNDLRYLVAFQSHTPTQDAAGQVVYTSGWANVLDDVPASIKATGGGEPGRSDGTVSVYTFDIECRYHPSLSAITNKWRIVCDTHGTLNVVSSARVIERGVEWLKIKATR